MRRANARWSKLVKTYDVSSWKRGRRYCRISDEEKWKIPINVSDAKNWQKLSFSARSFFLSSSLKFHRSEDNVPKYYDR